MNLNLALIANELSDVVNDVHFSKEHISAFNIASMRILYDAQDLLEKNCICICQPSRLQKILMECDTVTDRNFIIYGNEYGDLAELLKDNNYIFVSETHSFLYFINQIQDLFFTYGEWENRLLSAITSPVSLQELLDIAYEKIKIPMCILDINYQVIAINKQVNTTDKLYNSMKEGYGYPYVKLISICNPTLKEMEQEDIREVINSVSHNRLRVSTIRLQGQAVFFLGLHKQDTHPFDPLVLELYEYFVDILKQKAKFYPLQPVRSSLFGQFIADMISKKNLDHTTIQQLLSYFQYKQFDHYAVFAIRFLSPAHPQLTKLMDFMELLETTFADIKCFHINSYIGILTRNPDLSQFCSQLQKLLLKYHTHCAFSSCFKNICDIDKIWEQLMFVLDHWNGDDRALQNYDHYMVSHYTKFLRENLPAEALIHPYFITLKAFDQENHTDYTDTLIHYLHNNCSVSATANVLYIHRNSLHYRIKKIEELLNIKLSDPKEQKELLLSSYFANELSQE